MYKILAIFIVVIITSCLAQQRVYRFRNKRIPYEDDDYRDDDDDSNDIRNDMRDMRVHDYHNNDGPVNHGNAYNMNRHTHFDIGGRNPPYNRGPPFGIYGPQYQPQQPQPQPQPQPVQTPQSYQPQQQQPVQPYPAQNPDGTRATYNPYNPYGYGWNRPSYGWAPRPTYGSSFSIFNPFNLFGFGNYRPGGWGWGLGGNRFGLFF